MNETNQTMHWDREVDAIYKDTRWIVALEHAAAATSTVDRLREIGAGEPFVIAGVRGAGDIPEVEYLEILEVKAKGGLLDLSRAFEDALSNLPYPVQVKLDAWDPDRKARVLGAFFARGEPVAGREYFGGRPKAWQALEDKSVIDAFWDEVGVKRAPSAIVDADLESLQTAHRELHQGHGTIQVADNREGFNGGASHLRWVRNDDDQIEAAEFFAEHAHSVRVMPFLEGVPCSIHGIVFDDYVAALRPMEMVVLRHAESSKLEYMRAASFWDPADEDREMMREMAREVGAHLRETLEYRGAFTIDGVMTEAGFRPTELNPRYGAALGVMLSSLGLSMTTLLMHFALIEGVEADWKPQEFEALVLESADENRAGRVGCGVEAEVEETELFLSQVDKGWDEVEEGSHDLRVKIDPDDSGARLNIYLDPERISAGPHVAPLIASVLEDLDERLELGLSGLQPAENVR